MKHLLGCAMDIGEQMLICGAEVHRVEDSIKRMCHAFGAERVDVFIITSSMVVTVYTGNDDSHTQTRRIAGTGTNMEKLHHLNQLSRTICQGQLSLQQIQEEFSKIQEEKGYPQWTIFFAYALIAGAFTLFHGGNIQDASLALVIGLLIGFITYFADKVSMNKIFERFFCSFMVSASAYLFLKLGWIENVDKVIIGNIMTLIPGIGLTNALRDLFVGDSIAGLLRTIESLLAAFSIGAGYFLFIWMIGGISI